MQCSSLHLMTDAAVIDAMPLLLTVPSQHRWGVMTRTRFDMCGKEYLSQSQGSFGSLTLCLKIFVFARTLP